MTNKRIRTKQEKRTTPPTQKQYIISEMKRYLKQSRPKRTRFHKLFEAIDVYGY